MISTNLNNAKQHYTSQSLPTSNISHKLKLEPQFIMSNNSKETKPMDLDSDVAETQTAQEEDTEMKREDADQTITESESNAYPQPAPPEKTSENSNENIPEISAMQLTREYSHGDLMTTVSNENKPNSMEIYGWGCADPLLLSLVPESTGISIFFAFFLFWNLFILDFAHSQLWCNCPKPKKNTEKKVFFLFCFGDNNTNTHVKRQRLQ